VAERSERGQALPLVLGAALVVILSASLLVALGGAVTGAARAQRLADLTALSAARAMRDDFDRLFGPSRLEDGRSNPRHLTRGEYLARASAAARQAAANNGADPRRVQIEFPDSGSFAPVRVRVRVVGRLELRPAGRGKRTASDVVATAEAVASPSQAAAAEAPEAATGGGYHGPRAYRQGKPMRPDVAKAFDRLEAAARRAGLALVITSAFRSDAEQAELFARHPDPHWVAPPGESLHRCATELDLGPPAAYGWLAGTARRFGFLRRYSWEPWHFGYVNGPEPCARTRGPRFVADGQASAGGGLPAYVPARFRGAIARAASRWNVSASLLAAQLLAESNFNPFAVSLAGAQGIAQFMPGTAATYGLADPFDARAAIDAQAHLMSDLLEQFGSTGLALAAYNAGPAAVAGCSCVPPYPETQAYVARILGLLAGSGEVAVPELEVRLVR
jgi:Transglycosylase SLT domain/D-alanyl-D-alanine carboxypeptidase